jgi:lysozyme family protein
MISFNEAFTRLLGHEGGYVNNPADPGGETNWGISKRSYSNLDIKNLTRDQAMMIYYTDFWSPLGDADAAIKYQMFDFAVNSGINTALRKLQLVVGVADDGHWGPLSKAALATMSVNDTLLLLNAERLEFMTKLKNWPDASRGWARRIATNLRYAAKDN